MKSDNMFFIELAIFFLLFVLLTFINKKIGAKKINRCRQYIMPFIAFAYTIAILIYHEKIFEISSILLARLDEALYTYNLFAASASSDSIASSWDTFLVILLFNILVLSAYLLVKAIFIAIFCRIKIKEDTFIGGIIDLFYEYNVQDKCWYVKEHCGHPRKYINVAYNGGWFALINASLASCWLCSEGIIITPFYMIFAVITVGEILFFLNGLERKDKKGNLKMEADNSRRIVMYPLLRKPLKELFEDKLSAEGTTVNNASTINGSIEDILVGIERDGAHIGKNYAAFIRQKMDNGLRPNMDYVRSGYDLATGKSLLFNTPFYDKLNPYVFYAMNRQLIKGGKVLIVLGRHGTESDLYQWSKEGMSEVSNIQKLWKIEVLDREDEDEDNLPDIGIISRSGVHDLDIHKNNMHFLRKVSFVVIVEPSRLVTTAQIGLNLLIKCCGKDDSITFCSVDRNCDGLVDSLSHILMTNITEVSATEYPLGISSYMYWTADNEYLQHRILPGISRYLGMGTEISMVALKNQVKKATWYGGDAFPVIDAHWIAKQYYYDLLDYAHLPANQETFDECFKVSFNMCNERVRDYSFISVEDDRNNLFEVRRNFATMAEQQGFINVISSEYMLREYMSSNTKIFTADPKAIPYITADYARSKRNTILSLCLLLCIDSVHEDVLHRQLDLMNIETNDPILEVWKEICLIFGSGELFDKKGVPLLSIMNQDGKSMVFDKDSTIRFKRAYSVETGKFESVYVIDNIEFSKIILKDLQYASYIAEEESKDVYIGSELKGHVYQKYLPGQFFTLNGKYYEMSSVISNNRILVRRASEHITGRLAYRQVRNYKINHLEDSTTMGAIKYVNNIGIHYQFADFMVETPGYWKLHAYNDFDNGVLVEVNGVPNREYHHKQVLKLDFSKFGEDFTDTVRMTLTNLLNEVFVTLFAENQSFISAITLGSYDVPLTYSLEVGENISNIEKCIFIVEDSQLDIGLLVAVERNMNRILQIISDYLAWNDEKIQESIQKAEAPIEEKEATVFDVYADDESKEGNVGKVGLFGRIKNFFKGLFKRKKSKDETAETSDVAAPDEAAEASEIAAPDETAETSDVAAPDEAAETSDVAAPDETAETSDVAAPDEEVR